VWGRLKHYLSRKLPQRETLNGIGSAWRWGGALLTVALTATLIAQAPNFYGFAGVAAIVGLLLLIGAGAWLLLQVLAWLPPAARWGLLLLAVPLAPFVGSPRLFAAAYALLLTTLCLIAVGVLRLKDGRAWSGRALTVAGGLPLLIVAVALLLRGWHVDEATPPQIAAVPLDLPDPAARGDFRVVVRTYGAGTGRRPEFAEQVDWTADSVDGSKLLEGWDGAAGWARSGYWGVSADALPLAGRVWLPDGEGAFPVVLIVHGNHEMSDYSDVGYDYLGELLASRGFLTVSVDENFLNSAFADWVGGPGAGLEEESDARAWLLLEHLAAWRRWTADPGHPMHGKADLGRVVLIGHSRGGEAVSEAAVFNRLERYPDDGTLAFDFDFGIRGIIAIAPVDAQYNPRDQPTRPRDLSYLVIHGSHDADVNAYVGSALYNRLAFVDCGECFKAGFYLLNANHGQFNTAWGAFDAPAPFANLLNARTLMAAESQRRVAEVLFSAFVEVLLHGREEYRAFLARPERGARWFPEGVAFLSTYRDGKQMVLADFEEDADLDSATLANARVRTEGLALWKEAEVPLRWEDTDTAAVLLGCNDGVATDCVYELDLPGSDWLAPEMTLSFAAAMATEAPGDVEDYEPPASLDFEIELVDRRGTAARLALSERRRLYAQIDPVLYKLDVLDDDPATEVVFQRFAFPLTEWRARNPSLDLTSLTAIRFHLAGDPPASIWLDDVLISPDGL